MLDVLLRQIDRIRPPARACAHCDVPCGIYSTEPLRLAASTANNMVIKAHQLQKPAPDAPLADWLEFENTLARYIQHKEEHCTLFKRELYVLWSDFLKPLHFEDYPNLHDIFWNAAKLASDVKQSMDLEKARLLTEKAAEIGEIFKVCAAKSAAAAGRAVRH